MADPHHALVVDVGELIQDGDHVHPRGQAQAKGGAGRVAVRGQVRDLRMGWGCCGGVRGRSVRARNQEQKRMHGERDQLHNFSGVRTAHSEALGSIRKSSPACCRPACPGCGWSSASRRGRSFCCRTRKQSCRGRCGGGRGPGSCPAGETGVGGGQESAAAGGGARSPTPLVCMHVCHGACSSCL